MDRKQKNHLRGILLMALAVLILSPDTLLISVIAADRWTVVFWRGALTSVTLTAIMWIRYGRSSLGMSLRLGRLGLLVGAFFATSTLTFVSSVTLTTAANTLVIIAATPLVAAVLSRVFLGEQVPARTWAAVSAGLLAIVILLSGSLGGGALLGDLLAVATACAMAGNFVLIRRFDDLDMVPAVILSGILSTIATAPLADPFSVTGTDIFFLATMGTIVVPIPLMIMTIAPKLIPAPEVSLILLLETVLGPLWVWLAIGEEPAGRTIAGGILLVVTLLVHSIIGVRDAGRVSAQGF